MTVRRLGSKSLAGLVPVSIVPSGCVVMNLISSGIWNLPVDPVVKRQFFRLEYPKVFAEDGLGCFLVTILTEIDRG
jgi:hypothetical protein